MSNILQECPAGSVNGDTFKEIYEKFFPHGSKYLYKTISNIYSPLFLDATTYAHHVFKAFDIESTGSINFKVIHQVLSRKHGLHFPGHAGVIVDAVARDAAREAVLDLPDV